MINKSFLHLFFICFFCSLAWLTSCVSQAKELDELQIEKTESLTEGQKLQKSSEYMELGRNLRNDDPGLAIDYFNKAFELNPDWDEVYLEKAFVYLNWNVGLYYKAKENYTKYLAKYPDNAQALVQIAMNLISNGYLDEAEDMIVKAISLNGQEPYYYNEYAHIFFNRANYVKAIENLNKALSLRTDDGYIYMFRGEIYVYMNEKDKAIQDFEKAKQIFTTTNDSRGIDDIKRRMKELGLLK